MKTIDPQEGHNLSSKGGIKYSVIIPHFNSSKKLTRLIDSIQDRGDIEIVVVDDLSDPSEVDAIQQSVSIMTRSKVFFLDRKATAGGARNFGIDHSSGAWVLFADADDFFESCAFEVLDQAIQDAKGKFDVFFFKVQGFKEGSMQPSSRGKRLNKLIDEFDEFSRFQHVVPWAKMVRREIIDAYQLRFEEVRFSNDLMYSANLGFATSKIGLIKEILYNVEEGSSSLTAIRSEESAFERREVQLRFVTELFRKLPDTFVRRHRFRYYRVYLADTRTYQSPRLRALRVKYEKVAGLQSWNCYIAKDLLYRAFRKLHIKR